MINTPIKPLVTTVYRSDAFADVSSDDFQGKWNIVFFYPADFAFMCLTELADLQGIYVELQSLGVEVYSMSHDSHFAHKTWHETPPGIGTLESAIFGDVNGVITNNFDNTRPDSGLVDRSTYLTDPDGIIQYVETTPKSVDRSATELFRKVKTAQYVHNHSGEVCPAKWGEGEETLIPSFGLVGKI